ncbi:hypothetical protein KQ306_02480 [Synechococcus sp. CS-1324]|uniref:hypothetical protein n=1 Tax=Synechococcus sp. CS-1324 TaxID=2847980 RepID=UPI000DB3887F|nr:hypothetical protein [Synechococcus sp. CS-1324]MCT0229730.1 hypothetical protein [Synechococcus sp. CS-1324]PZV02483.1 MAG: hypothetical protein DCF23_11465 [Cyanobium sp.]
MLQPFPPPLARTLVGGLRDLIAVEGGATPEQARLLRSLAVHLLGLIPDELTAIAPLPPPALALQLTGEESRRRFLQLAIMLELCRHPRSEAQLQRLEAFSNALGLQGVELRLVQDLFHRTAADATADFVRCYAAFLPELSSRHGAAAGTDLGDAFFAQVQGLRDCPHGSLGWAFAQFYARNGLPLPSRDTPNPAYYVTHDMNHVITGYEPTGPGEIALGAFKLALRNDDANWMASLANFLIHEVGLFVHGDNNQFEPYGGDGEPYNGLNGKRGALDLPGAPELLAEAWRRGAACSGDFSRLDHLAFATEPLLEIRRRFHVLPLERPMLDQPEFWPSGA